LETIDPRRDSRAIESILHQAIPEECAMRTSNVTGLVLAAGVMWLLDSSPAAQSQQAHSLPVFEVDNSWPRVP
jgi:hypothetical protein